MQSLLPIIQAGLGIGLLIFIHELGHYLAARLAGVRVEVFSLGFGTRILGFRWRGTDYRLSAVPIGGYVRVAGEDPTQRQGLAQDDLHAKGFGARALFFSGGVLMNLLFALVAFPIVFHRGVEFNAPVIGTVVPGGAAWVAGIEPGDRVLSVDGKQMYSFDNMMVEVALAGADGCSLQIERGEETFPVGISARYSERVGLFQLGVSQDFTEILVSEVDDAAKAAGLRVDDQIVAVGEVDGDVPALRTELVSVEPGAELQLTVLRDGAPQQLWIPTGTRQSSGVRIGVVPGTRRIAAVRASAALELLDLRPGDELLRVGDQPFWGDPATLVDGPDPLLLTIVRQGSELQLEARLDPEQRRKLADSLAFDLPDDGVFVRPMPDSAAARAGLLPGDRIERFGAVPLQQWTDLQRAVAAAGTAPSEVIVRRGDDRNTLTLAAEHATEVDLGFGVSIPERRELFQVDTVGGAIKAGMVASVDLVKQLYVTLKRIVTGDVSAKNLGGIITISRVSYIYAQSGWERFLYFLALLSINLAFINVLPIPVLDGGHLMFLLIERIKGSPVSANVLNYSQILGMVFVLALLVFVTYHDILRLLV